MSGDKKKRWIVLTWKDEPLGAATQTEAQDLENQLNAMAASEYQLYRINFKRKLIVGCHIEAEDDESGVEDDESKEGDDQSSLEAFADSLETTESDEESHDLRGQFSMKLFNALHFICQAKERGDPYTAARITRLIKKLFGKCPTFEIEKSLEDMREFRRQHGKCEDETCLTIIILSTAEKELEACLAANRAN
jgi:hypothetical protein